MSNQSPQHQRAADHEHRRSLLSAKLYGILDLGYVPVDRATVVAGQLIEGGVQVLQLRAKNYTPDSLIPVAREIAAVCRQHHVPFLLNDFVEFVAKAGADGVHIGQDDMSIAGAKRCIGPWAIIGKSTHSPAQAAAAEAEGADYIGFGPLFPTPTKPDYTAIGTEELGTINTSIRIPAFCIGGIKKDNLLDVIEAGARRVVIVSGLLLAPDVKTMTRECRAILDQTLPVRDGHAGQ